MQIQEQEVGRCVDVPFSTSALEGGEWSSARPGRYTPRERDPVSILQNVGWALGQVMHRYGKSLPSRGSNLWLSSL
jgi:hypothetical protein